MKRLKYEYVWDEEGNIVRADKVNRESKMRSKYYIEGVGETGEIEREEVILNICKNKRNYFRRYPEDKVMRRVEIDIKRYNEGVIHKLAKDLIISGVVREISLPENRLELGGGDLQISGRRWFKVVRAYREYVDKENGLRYDVVVEDSKGNKLGVEIYVTHGVDNEKYNKISRAGMDVIEIDLSGIIVDGDIVDSSVEGKIKDIITQGSSETVWVYNKERERVESWYKNLRELECVRTKHNRDIDGEWFISVINRYGSVCKQMYGMDNCSYRNAIIRGESKYRAIVEAECKRCKRYVLSEWDEDSVVGRVVCNQSKDISNEEMLRLLYRLNKPMR